MGPHRELSRKENMVFCGCFCYEVLEHCRTLLIPLVCRYDCIHILQWTPFLEPRSGIWNSLFFLIFLFLLRMKTFEMTVPCWNQIIFRNWVTNFFKNLGCFMKIAVFSSVRDLLEAIFF